MAVKFDIFNGSGEGSNSTGFYTNGASPTLPALDMTSSGVNLHSGNTMGAHLMYDGTTLTLTVTDLVTTASYTTSTAINIPATVGGNTAYVGFTGGTGGFDCHAEDPHLDVRGALTARDRPQHLHWRVRRHDERPGVQTGRHCPRGAQWRSAHAEPVAVERGCVS